MLALRVIPCLDVKDGRVVKGVNFLALRDAGDPVEQARTSGPDHVVDGLPGIVPDPPDPGAPALHPTSERSAP